MPLKTQGGTQLRDGAYFLPKKNNHAASLLELAEQINAEGGEAWLANVVPHSAGDKAAFEALFDLSTKYAVLRSHRRISASGQKPPFISLLSGILTIKIDYYCL